MMKGCNGIIVQVYSCIKHGTKSYEKQILSVHVAMSAARVPTTLQKSAVLECIRSLLSDMAQDSQVESPRQQKAHSAGGSGSKLPPVSTRGTACLKCCLYYLY